jgi:hypothetical protein
MQWQFPGKNVREIGMFQAEQTDSTSVILRGHWLLWDETDNRAVAGILDETRGYRVILLGESKSARVAGVVEVAPAVTGTNLAASQRMPPFTMQAWGYHDAAYVLTSQTSTLGVTTLKMSATAGCAQDQVTADFTNLGVTGIGTVMETISGATTIQVRKVFVRTV